MHSRFFRPIFYGVSALIVLVSIILNVGRLTVVYLNHHPEKIAAVVSHALHENISIQHIHLSVEGFTPVLDIQGVQSFDAKTHALQFGFDEFVLHLDVWASLHQHRWILSDIAVRGVDVAIQQNAQGEWALQSVDQLSPNGNNGLFAWLLAQPRFSISDATVQMTTNKNQVFQFEHVNAVAEGGTDSTERLAIQGSWARKQWVPFQAIFSVVFQPNNNAALSVQAVQGYVAVQHFSLSDLSLFALPIPTASLPQGLVSARVWLDRDAAHWQDVVAQIQATDLRIPRAKASTIALSKISGDFLLRPMKDQFELLGRHLHIQLPTNLNATLLGSFAVFWRPDTLFIRHFSLHNDALHFQTRGRIVFPDKDLSLLGHFQIMKIGGLWPWLVPFGLDPASARAAQHAISTGEVTNGLWVWHGRLSDFPYIHQDGALTLQAQVKNVTVQYQQKWPAVESIGGHLEWHNDSLVLTNAQASVMGMSITAISANIMHLFKPVLSVHVQTPLSLEKIAPFVQRTAGASAGLFKPLQAQGTAQLQLALQWPLLDHQQPVIQGKLSLFNDTVIWNDLPSDFHFTQVKGTLQFQNGTLTSQHLSAIWLGQPMELNMQTVRGAKPELQLIGQSQIAPLTRFKALKPALGSIIQGWAAYTLQLDLPFAADAPNTLTIRSNLKGLSIHLKNWYQKLASDTRAMQFQLTFLDANHWLWSLTDGHQLHSSGLFVQTKGLWELQRLDVNLCGKPAATPTGAGLTACLQIPKLTLSDLSLSDMNAPSAFAFPTLQKLQILANEFDVTGQQYKHFNGVVESKLGGLWVIHVNSPMMMGAFEYTKNPEAITGSFDTLTITTPLATTPTKSSSAIALSALPALDVHAQTLRWNQMNLGPASIATHPVAGGVAIDHLSLHPNGCTMTQSGTWQETGGDTLHLFGLLHCDDFGAALHAQYPQSMLVGGAGDVHDDLTWALTQKPAFAGLDGTLQLNIQNGVIVGLSDQEKSAVGVGKLLNMFSLHDIGSRIKNGFKDLASTGYSFSTLRADFTVQSGVAETPNLIFDGPVAKITAKGKIDLVRSHYAFDLTILPYVTSSIPVVAAFAGGPIVGAAAYLVNQIVSGSVSHAVEKQYTLSGQFGSDQATAIPMPADTQTRSAS